MSARRHPPQPGFTLVELCLAISLLGILLAMAAPTFVDALRTSKTAEASELLARMVQGASSYYVAFHDPDGSGPQGHRTHCLPPAAGPQPEEPGPEPQPPPFEDPTLPGAATWLALNFRPPHPVHYAYSFEPTASGCGLAEERVPPTVVFSAEGDLDGDGKRSRFMRRGRATRKGLELDPLLFVDRRVEQCAAWRRASAPNHRLTERKWQTGSALPDDCQPGEGGDDGGIPPFPIPDGGVPPFPEVDGGAPPFPIPTPGEIAPVPIDVTFLTDCYFVDYLWAEYHSLSLEDSGDIYVGGSPGDAQPCYGDSGGPLVRVSSGTLTAYGVTSGGVSSDRLQCDRGGIYARFIPATLAFLKKALEWVDPCDGLTVRGACDGSVARRCTSPLEGKRRAVELDCSLLGLSCEPQADGTVGCGEDDSFGHIPHPTMQGEPFPDLRKRERHFFRPSLAETITITE